MTTLDQLRERIAALHREDAALRDAPASGSEQHAALTAWCQQQADAAAPAFAHQVNGVAHGNSLDSLFRVWLPGGGTIDLAPIVFALFGAEGVAEMLARHFSGGSTGPAAAERVARLAEIDAERLELEQVEEELVVASEAAGAPVARRHDADVRAILGVREVPVGNGGDLKQPAAPVVATAPMPKLERVARSEYAARSRRNA